MRRILTVVGVVLLTTMMAGCIGPEPGGRHKPSPSPTPVFASDEEALAAAEAAYGAYLAVSDAISSDGGANPERLAASVTAEELAESIELYKSFEIEGIRTRGTTTFDSVALQRADDYEVAIYLCLDVTQVRMIDTGGADVTPASRINRVPLEVIFLVGSDQQLLLDSSDVWRDGETCER